MEATQTLVNTSVKSGASGGTFHVPHGLSNALVLPHVLRFNALERFSEKAMSVFDGQARPSGSLEAENTLDAATLYAQIAADAFPHLASVEGSQGRCAAFIEELAALARKLGMQTRLREVGIGQEHLAQMASDAMKQQRLLVNNPRPVEEADALAIYRAAW